MENYSMSLPWHQPVSVEVQKLVPNDEHIIYSFFGDYYKPGFRYDLKIYEGIWVITNKKLYFAGKANIFSFPQATGFQIRVIPFSQIIKLKPRWNEIYIYWLKNPLKPKRKSKRAIVVKKLKGEPKSEYKNRILELPDMISSLIQKQHEP